MVIAITGGTGFIGTHLATAIPDAVLFDFPKNDLRNIEDACAFIDKWQPEVVYHLAAQPLVTNEDDMDTLSTNIVGTYNLLHACRNDKNLRSFVHIATDKVYGAGRVTRASPLKGIGHPYNVSKLCGDVIAQMYAKYYELPIRIIRTANIYGPGDTHYDRIIPGTIKATLEGVPIELRSNGHFIRDYIYISDLIPAYLRISNEPPGVYNLGGEETSVLEVVQTILRLMKREDLQPIILDSQHNELDYQHVDDCPKWWEPEVKLEDGLERTIRYEYSRFGKSI